MNYEIVHKEQNLRIFLENNEDWELLDDICGMELSGEDKLSMLMEETGLLGNSELNFVAPEQIGAFTDSALIATSPLMEKEDFNEDYMVWWFSNYQIKDPFYELAEKGEVIFDNAIKTCMFINSKKFL